MKTSLDNSLITNARQVPIETVLGLLGARPSQKEAHKWYCPVHGGSSFHVWTETNRGMCFGCGITKGRAIDSIGLLMAVRGLSFPEAVKQLSEIKKPSESRKVISFSSKKGKTDIEPSPEMNSRIYYDLLRLARTQDQTHGKDYLESRGISWEWAFEKYGLTWIETPKVVYEFLRDNYWPDEIQLSGLVNKKGNFNYWFPILLAPYFKDDYIIEIEGLIRKTDRGKFLPKGVKSLALSGVPRNLWGLNHAEKGEEAVLVEGVIDALSIILLTGKENVLAVPGVGQIEKALQEKIGLLSRLRVLADRDEHGEGFSKKLRDQLAARFPNVEITLNRYPEGVNDGNEWLMQKTLMAA